MTEPPEAAPTGKSSDIPAETQPEGEPLNPFEAFRARTLIPWMILGGVLLLASVYLVSLFTPLDPGDPATGDVLRMLSLYGALLLGWVVWVCRRAGVGLGRLVGRIPAGHSWWTTLGLLIVTMAFSAGSWGIFAYGLALAAPGVLEFLLEAGERMPDAPLAYQVAVAVVAVVLAPAIEELLFRGVLLNRWAAKWSVARAVVATSVAFGILHGNPVGVTVAGLVMAVLYLRTGTLLVPIAFHATNNLIATILEFMAGPLEPVDVAAQIQEIRDGALWAIVIVAVTLPVLVWYLRRNWPSREARIPYLTDYRATDTRGIAENP
ncbi:MAG: CPBP family intramembrane metalloprotease [Gemmatimonadetes bacterium]|nr:CPBP family intramembrane metalloprotease [Gemmatimonadota bacterium]MYB97019.1 CPBP family intramembrane metalloprotease [Gemmatimonadota bacterium]MYI45632.1 CPBP family intramembrane metalloprotease [Gemmatimonadota bacterium]